MNDYNKGNVIHAINLSADGYGGHFDFYCFERHYGILRRQIKIKMAAVSAKGSNGGGRNSNIVIR